MYMRISIGCIQYYLYFNVFVFIWLNIFQLYFDLVWVSFGRTHRARDWSQDDLGPNLDQSI